MAITKEQTKVSPIFAMLGAGEGNDCDLEFAPRPLIIGVSSFLASDKGLHLPPAQIRQRLRGRERFHPGSPG